MNPAELKTQFTGYVFDEIELDIEPESLVGFATACGETQSRFTDPDDPRASTAHGRCPRIFRSR